MSLPVLLLVLNLIGLVIGAATAAVVAQIRRVWPRWRRALIEGFGENEGCDDVAAALADGVAASLNRAARMRELGVAA